MRAALRDSDARLTHPRPTKRLNRAMSIGACGLRACIVPAHDLLAMTIVLDFCESGVAGAPQNVLGRNLLSRCPLCTSVLMSVSLRRWQRRPTWLCTAKQFSGAHEVWQGRRILTALSRGDLRAPGRSTTTLCPCITRDCRCERCWAAMAQRYHLLAAGRAADHPVALALAATPQTSCAPRPACPARRRPALHCVRCLGCMLLTWKEKVCAVQFTTAWNRGRAPAVVQ